MDSIKIERDTIQQELAQSSVKNLMIWYSEAYHELRPEKMQMVIMECRNRGLDFWSEYIKYIKCLLNT